MTEAKPGRPPEVDPACRDLYEAAHGLLDALDGTFQPEHVRDAMRKLITAMVDAREGQDG